MTEYMSKLAAVVDEENNVLRIMAVQVADDGTTTETADDGTVVVVPDGQIATPGGFYEDRKFLPPWAHDPPPEEAPIS